MSNAGQQLSYAATAAAEAHRLLIASALHLDAGGARFAPQAEAEFAELLSDANAYAAELQRLADDHGHREVERRIRHAEARAAA